MVQPFRWLVLDAKAVVVPPTTILTLHTDFPFSSVLSFSYIGISHTDRSRWMRGVLFEGDRHIALSRPETLFPINPMPSLEHVYHIPHLSGSELAWVQLKHAGGALFSPSVSPMFPVLIA